MCIIYSAYTEEGLLVLSVSVNRVTLSWKQNSEETLSLVKQCATVLISSCYSYEFSAVAVGTAGPQKELLLYLQ